jgi:hypothetical protein
VRQIYRVAWVHARIYWLKCQIATTIFQQIKKVTRMVLDRNQNALFKRYHKSVPKLICTSYSAINDNRELCFVLIQFRRLASWYLYWCHWMAEITNTRDESICRW